MKHASSFCRALVGAFVVSLILAFAACEQEPATRTPATNVSSKQPPGPNDTGEPKPVRRPIATQVTEWPGIEARLMECSARGGTLLVEIELANTGATPVEIENYSARAATMVDDVTRTAFGVLVLGGPPVATDGLTQSLAPGETTSVTASFPLNKKAQLVTLTFPRIAKFEAIPLKPRTNDSGQASANENLRDQRRGAHAPATPGH